MKLNKSLLLVLFGLMLFSFCTNFSHEIIQVKELQSKYDHLSIKVDSVDVKLSANKLKEYDNIIDSFRNRMDKEKLPNQSTMNFINQFRSAKQTFKKTPKKVSRLKKSIKTNIEQLTNLENDLRNKSLKKQDVVNFLNEEKLELERLYKDHYNIVSELNAQITRFDSLIIQSKSITLN